MYSAQFNSDEYIFRYPNGERAIQEQLTKAFKRLLKYIDNDGKEDGLLKDDFGNQRTLYCLRHTYASRRRYEGMSFDDLSVQMGTSVKMLEDHYSSQPTLGTEGLAIGPLSCVIDNSVAFRYFAGPQNKVVYSSYTRFATTGRWRGTENKS